MIEDQLADSWRSRGELELIFLGSMKKGKDMNKKIFSAILAVGMLFSGCASKAGRNPASTVRLEKSNTATVQTKLTSGITINGENVKTSSEEVRADGNTLPETNEPSPPAEEPVDQGPLESDTDSAREGNGGGEAPQAESPDQKLPGVETAPDSEMAPGVENTSRISDYFPLAENQLYSYLTADGGTADMKLQYLRREADRVTAQLKIRQGGKDIIRVMEVTDTAFKELYESEDMPYRANIIGRAEYREVVLMKSPLVIGNKWQTGDYQAEIIALDEALELNGVTYSALVVRLTNDRETLDYHYGKNLGLLRLERLPAGQSPAGELKSGTEGIGVPVMEFIGREDQVTDNYLIKLYFPEAGGNFTILEKELKFKTNDITREMLGDLYTATALAEGRPVVIPEGGVIQFLFELDDAVYVDLNKAFVEHINDHPDQEEATIKALIKTMAGFYGVDKAYLTIDDQRYESNQTKIEKGTALSPD